MDAAWERVESIEEEENCISESEGGALLRERELLVSKLSSIGPYDHISFENGLKFVRERLETGDYHAAQDALRMTKRLLQIHGERSRIRIASSVTLITPVRTPLPAPSSSSKRRGRAKEDPGDPISSWE